MAVVLNMWPAYPFDVTRNKNVFRTKMYKKIAKMLMNFFTLIS